MPWSRFLFVVLLIFPAVCCAQAITSSQCEQNSGTQYCEPKIRLWGGDAWGGPLIYPSFGDAVGGLMPFVMNFTGPSAYPATFPRPEGLPFPQRLF